MADENVFAFDTSPFIQGIKKIGNGIGALQKNAVNMASSVSKGVTNAIAKIGLLAVAFKGVQAAIKEMPEIGQAFGIAKDVIMKNLLFPLRKAVFPLLQKFLNWVRDNRAMFVRWGQTLANIFQSVVSAVGDVITIGKELFNTFLGFVNKIFGTNIKSLQDIFNILSFKFAVLIEFFKALAKPVGSLVSTLIDSFAPVLGTILETVGKIVSSLLQVTGQGNSIFTIFESIVELFGSIAGFVANIVSGFVDGFIPYLAPIINSVQKMVDAFQSIFDSIFGSNEAMSGWRSLFEFLGNVVGGGLATAFELIAGYVDLWAKGVNLIVEGFKWIAENIKGIAEDLNIADNVGNFIGGVGKGLSDFGSFLNPFDDVIVTSQGQVVPVNSADDIVSFKPGGPVDQAIGGKGVVVNIDFKGMQLVLQDASPGEAQRFSETIVDMFRTTLTNELESAGLK